MRTKFFPLIAVFLPLLAACGYPTPPCQPSSADKVWVVSRDWHSDIAIPVGELGNSMQDIVAQFPGAKALEFGYGKESFMTAPPGSFTKYFTGIFPGQAAIEVEALDRDPSDAYPPDEVVTLALPLDGARKLSAFIRRDIADNADGSPILLRQWQNSHTYIYAANSEYNFLHTCNGWAADTLADAGVSLSPSRVVTSNRLMIRARDAAERCEDRSK